MKYSISGIMLPGFYGCMKDGKVVEVIHSLERSRFLNFDEIVMCQTDFDKFREDNYLHDWVREVEIVEV